MDAIKVFIQFVGVVVVFVRAGNRVMCLQWSLEQMVSKLRLSLIPWRFCVKFCHCVQ